MHDEGIYIRRIILDRLSEERKKLDEMDDHLNLVREEEADGDMIDEWEKRDIQEGVVRGIEICIICIDGE